VHDEERCVGGLANLLVDLVGQPVEDGIRRPRTARDVDQRVPGSVDVELPLDHVNAGGLAVLGEGPVDRYEEVIAATVVPPGEHRADIRLQRKVAHTQLRLGAGLVGEGGPRRLEIGRVGAHSSTA
jgi:hypothetical protein